MALHQHIKRIARFKGDRLRFHRTLYFPRHFLWGAATSAYQVEGKNTNSDWSEWEKNFSTRSHSGNACNHYELYEKDFDYAKDLHQNAHRFSIEWSRVEPKEGEWDKNAVEHYRNVILALHKRRIQPVITLHHFTNPGWFQKKGGWTRRRSVFYFLRFVRFVIGELGDIAHFWITVNEPMVYCTMSYLSGVWPPGKKSYFLSYRAYHNLARAHRGAYRIIHSLYKKKDWHPPKVGAAINSVSLHTYQKHSFLSWLFMRVSDWIWNHSFYFLTGETHDFIGINYYFHYRLKEPHFRTIKFFLEARNEKREMSSVGWEVYPQGIFDVLLDFRRYKIPIYITENGIATTNESKRSRYIVSYLKEVYHAIQAGVDVRGYFYWSLMDNFEWEKGFAPRFGLLDVNYKTYQRTYRQAALVYSEICKTNSIPHHLLAYIGHSVERERRKRL